MTETSFSGEKDDGSSPQKLSLKSHGSVDLSRESRILLDKGEILTVKDLSSLSLDSKLLVLSACSAGLSNTPEVCKAEVMYRVQTYVKQSKQKKRLHNILQLTIFIGAALITATLAIPDIPKIVPALLGTVVTVATAIANYYKFGERGRDIFLVAEELGLEHNRFDTMRGIYKNLSPEDAFTLFMDRVEMIIHEDTKRCFALERSTIEPKTDSALKQP